jgi:hypothetical protein
MQRFKPAMIVSLCVLMPVLLAACELRLGR